MPSTLLPIIEKPEDFLKISKQNDVWDHAVAKIARDHGLSDTPTRARHGSHIVYRVGEAWLKLMAPLFAKDMDYEIAGLECVGGKTSVPTPLIIAKGEVEKWPFVILSHVEGRRIGEVFPSLTLSEQLELTSLMVDATKSLHRIPPTEAVLNRGEWNHFIQERFKNVVAHHTRKGLAKPWLEKIPSFLSQFSIDEFLMENPPFIHADLTFDHFFVDENLKISGLIDFADCRVGHPEYEMIATAIFILKKNREALRRYVKEMNQGEWTDRYSEKFMAWTVLHYYSNLNTYFAKEMTEVIPGDYSALARLVFPL